MAVADAWNANVLLPSPGAPIDDGVRLAVTPFGKPETDKPTAELNVPTCVLLEADRVTCDEPLPGTRVAGEAVIVRPGGAPLIQRVNAVLKPPATVPQVSSHVLLARADTGAHDGRQVVAHDVLGRKVYAIGGGSGCRDHELHGGAGRGRAGPLRVQIGLR